MAVSKRWGSKRSAPNKSASESSKRSASAEIRRTTFRETAAASARWPSRDQLAGGMLPNKSISNNLFPKGSVTKSSDFQRNESNLEKFYYVC